MASSDYQSFIARTLRGDLKPMRLDDASGEYEEWPITVIPVGGIYLSTLSTDPGLAQASGGLGYGAWERYAQGLCVVGVHDSDSDWAAGNTIGAKTATPAGTVSAPTFTGSSVASQSVSAGTPAGTNSAPTFTGSALASHSHTPGTLATSAHTGTAVADHASHTHTYTQVPNHVHVERAQGGTTASTTGTHLMTSAATGGSLRSAATSTLDPTGGVATGTTNGPGATMTHSVTQPAAHTLSGATSSDSAGTPAGTVSAPTFTGSALAGHAHDVTAAGTVSAPTFTGQAMSVVQPSIAVYVWCRVG